MEEKGQHEVTSDITVNHYDEEYKFFLSKKKKKKKKNINFMQRFM